MLSLCSVAVGALLLVSCSDKFLEDKKNYDNYTQDVLNDKQGAILRVNAIYGECLPNPSAAASWNNNQTGYQDDQSKCTEEFYGFGAFVNPTPGSELSAMSGTIVPDYFQYQQNYLVNVWGRIRGINDAIQGIGNSTLSQDDKNELLGQCYFFRAWCYYQLVKWYGGVPIVKEVQPTESSSFTPRSSAKACFEFIVSDLNQAAEMLKKATMNGKGWDDSNWGRVTTGTALALKGRVLMLWCSPLFNRENKPDRWTSAYETMKNDLTSIEQSGYSLYGETAPGINAAEFAKMFVTRNCPEAVFVALHNSFTDQGGIDNNVWNNAWERKIRPINTQVKESGWDASALLVDLFPMKDGKVPAHANNYTKLKPSTYPSDASISVEDYPFIDRDPRFYRTFAFPGVRWAYKGSANTGGNEYPQVGEEYELWNYVWYANSTDEDDTNLESGTRYGADGLLNNVRGIYIRKRSDDLDNNSSPLYSYNAADPNGGFARSGAPYMEIRFAEVLLNLAEAACGANDVNQALIYLNRVRSRAGVPALKTEDFRGGDNQASCMSAILYERMIEFAYEGKRFDDMRRWMLFDGGRNLSEIPGGAPQTWTLKGWNGNTCSWLGINAANNMQRRERIEFHSIRPGYGKTTADDPIKKAEKEGDATAARCAALNYNNDMYTPDATGKTQQQKLYEWYKNNVKRVTRGGDGFLNHAKQYPHFYAKYYFLGLSLGALNRNDSRLQQTIGWEGKNGMGTFDPLAE